MRTQPGLFLRLRIYEEAARAVLETLPEAESEPEPPHVLLFGGRRIDGRETPRFPQDPDKNRRRARHEFNAETPAATPAAACYSSSCCGN